MTEKEERSQENSGTGESGRGRVSGGSSKKGTDKGAEKMLEDRALEGQLKPHGSDWNGRAGGGKVEVMVLWAQMNYGILHLWWL